MFAMNESNLKCVCGGDNGDADKDNNPKKSRYEVGQWVELYNTGFHVSTEKSCVMEKEFRDGCWHYYFDIFVKIFGRQISYSEWYTADRIQS